MIVNRVPGHTLLNEGAPFERVVDEVFVRTRRINTNGVGGEGRGVCSCGTFSDILPSAGRRKSWHREHKKAVLQRGAS